MSKFLNMFGIVSIFVVSITLSGCGGSDTESTSNPNQTDGSGDITQTNQQKDTIAPEINILGENPVTIEYGVSYSDDGATAIDIVDGEVTVSASSNLDTKKLGQYFVEYKAMDKAGNQAMVTRIVNVVDRTAPIISIAGENPVTIEYGTQYVDEGALAEDNVEGAVAVSAAMSIDKFKLGQHSIVYSATDKSGNTASITRIVNVVDTTAPIITIAGENPVNIEYGTQYVDEGASAEDNVDGAVAVSATMSIDKFKLGQHSIVYSATDKLGNTASITRIVNVVDTTAPIITIVGENPVNIEYGTRYVDEGALAEDEVDGAIAISTVHKVDNSKLGQYSVVFSATDKSGNNALERRIVNVIDTTAPVITLIGEAEIRAAQGEEYQEPGFIATDFIDGKVAVVVSGNVDTSVRGLYKLTYTATDKSGNQASVNRTVEVLPNPLLATVILDQQLLACANNGEVNRVLQVVELDCYDKNINSVVGLEHMVNLKVLNLYGNNLTTIDIRRNIHLESLNLGYNQLSQIDLSQNTKLNSLSLKNNKLSEIDVTNNILLKDLNLGGNQISEIDISTLTGLLGLELNSNNISHLDITNNNALKYIHAEQNRLTEIDLSKTPNLSSLSLIDNQLSQIDLSQNLALLNLRLAKNMFFDVDVSKNKQLKELSLAYNYLTEVDVSENTELLKLWLGNNRFPEVDLTKNKQLVILSAFDGELTQLDLSENYKLQVLNLANNQLSYIDLTKNTTLVRFWATGNDITEIDLSNNKILSYVELDPSVVCIGSTCP
ncbi:hypothetical protein PSECIP111951_02015 [Pseudoalteromonas holothuriae]|uniref:Pesticidal crystal protein Cry22Aa Ig-like domain-containing protein n=1 Tax=Pseudoalteromonas holothuriae TaxID=2963714 RepID=A0ABN8UP63_9GAMM|nr:immunoglobulin-like domain-containing protein [Pseudoalteromonas sp. CIP111951]CAH9059147.1 hypothetical protein PSECIP111951_02015 [Pseudoalteromonas sp. CIP111951]